MTKFIRVESHNAVTHYSTRFYKLIGNNVCVQINDSVRIVATIN